MQINRYVKGTHVTFHRIPRHRLQQFAKGDRRSCRRSARTSFLRVLHDTASFQCRISIKPLEYFFNTVVFEGLKTVQQTVEHLVPAVVEHLTTVIVRVVIFVDVNIVVPACTVFLNEFLKLTETAHFQERYKGVIFAGIVQNLGFVQDLKEPLRVHIVPIGRVGREAVNVLNEQLLVDTVKFKALTLQFFHDLVPVSIVGPVKPTGSQSTLITFVVRALRADDDSDFVPGRIRNTER